MAVLHILGVILKILGITVLSVLGLIILVLLLISLVRVGIDAEYIGGSAKVSAKVCGRLIELYPDGPIVEKLKNRHKKEKPKETPPPADKPPAEEKPKKRLKLKLDFTRDEIMALVKKVLHGVGRILTIRVDRFLLHFTAAGDDPYNTALIYGYVNGALSSLAPLCRKKFRVQESDVRTDVDFTADSMSIDAGIAVTMRIGQLFEGLFIIAFGALGILIKNKLRLAKEKRAAKGLSADGENEENKETNIDKTEENIQAEERMDKNG